MTIQLIRELKKAGIDLWVEDGSRLRFKAKPGAMTDEVKARLKASKQDIIAVLVKAAQISTVADEVIERVPADTRIPLTFSQERLWFMDNLEPDSEAYNMPFAYRLSGSLDLDALERCFAQIFKRHTILRAYFPNDGGVPLQKIHPLPEQLIDFRDLCHHPEKDREKLCLRAIQAESVRPFTLATGNLVRIQVYRLNERSHFIFINMHHIVSDGWSVEIFFREMVENYSAVVRGESMAAPPLSLQYADYAVWQRNRLKGAFLDGRLSFWKNYLEGYPTLLDLPFDRPRPLNQSYHGAIQSFSVADQTTSALTHLSVQSGTSLFILLETAFAALLGRYTNREHLLLGTPVANRDQKQLEPLIGLFMNTLVLANDLSGDPSFAELLERSRTLHLDAFAHQDLPFENIVDLVQPERNLSTSPIFQVMFTLQEQPTNIIEMPNLTMVPHDLDSHISKFDLTLFMVRRGERLEGTVEYNTDLFENGSIQRFIEHFNIMLTNIAAQPQKRLSHQDILTEREKRVLLTEWNNTPMDYPRESTIHGLFQEQVRRSPDKDALLFDTGGELLHLTYRELDTRTNQVARILRDHGVGPDHCVAVCMERSVHLPVALLAILKAGGAYVPLDPKFPAQRVAYVLADADIKVLLTQKSDASLFDDQAAQIICVDDLPDETAATPVSQGCSDNLSYVIYTSGSTGKSKGVRVCHQTVVNFMVGMDHMICPNPGIWLALTNVTFDISVLELFWTLTRGFSIAFRRDILEAFNTTEAQTNSKIDRHIDFGLFYFADDESSEPGGKYNLLLNGARFADENGFSSVWTPERHFHTFGGLYPNPSVTGAAVAAVTKNVGIRSGSCVLPLHHPARVAEEWSVVDNISDGRVGLAFASGWVPEDFIYNPDHYGDRKEYMFTAIEQVRALWRGEAVDFLDGAGRMTATRTLPRPIQANLPVWITAAGNPESFRMAGEIGANLLTHLLGQTIEDVRDKVAIYRKAFKDGGHKGRGHVTIMMHTFVDKDLEYVREKVREPFKNYLRSSIGLFSQMAKSVGQELKPDDYDQDAVNAILDHAFDRYFDTAALFGTPDTCLPLVDRLKEIDVDEIGCLIDFGVGYPAAMEGLKYLNEVRRRAIYQRPPSVLNSALDNRVTHMQCTPSMAQLLVDQPEMESVLAGLHTLMLGGEALPTPLVDRIRKRSPARILNMYGPTETTIWSSVQTVKGTKQGIPIGKPIANTQLYVVDKHLNIQPIGVPGELLIGGDGVVQGYLKRPDLTAERFIPDPYAARGGTRLYRTGDLVRYQANGDLEFMGRLDFQIKLRGFRIELGEIEANLNRHPAVREAAVMLREDRPGDKKLVAYIVAQGEPATVSDFRAFLSRDMPEYMVPGLYVTLEKMPLTPSGKVNRHALPKPKLKTEASVRSLPETPEEKILAEIWCEVLNLEQVGMDDNFFELGGDSIVSIQVVSKAKQRGLQITPKMFFRNQTIAKLAKAALETNEAVVTEQEPVTGEMPLTAIQQWFFDLQSPAAHHYNQAMMLQTEELDPSILQKALAALIDHHDALRQRYRVEEDRVVTSHTPIGGAVPLTDLGLLSPDKWQTELATAADSAQRSLNLAEGPLIRAVFARVPGHRARLLLVIHHLVVDGISWRILFEDLETAYLMLAAGGGQAHLPAKTTSFQRWSAKLADYAQSAALVRESAYWLDPARSGVPDLPLDFVVEPTERTVADMVHIRIEFDAELTGALLVEVPQAYNTQINDILLTALARTLTAWTGGSSCLVNLEGHGREDLFEHVDLTRTVGWLTTLFPVLLHVGGSLSGDIKSVKEQLRALPNRGIGYGLLRFHHETLGPQLAAQPLAEVGFNYLGRFDQAMGTDALFNFAPEPPGEPHAENMVYPYLLDINGSITRDTLIFDFAYNRNAFKKETIDRLTQSFHHQLSGLIQHCRTLGSRVFTPSDFPYAQLKQKELDSLFQRCGDNGENLDIYALSPMQEGLLFQSLYDTSNTAYYEQVSWVMEGDLDEEAYRMAWEEVLVRHSVLRSAFFWEGLDHPVQVVFNTISLPFRILDWSRETDPQDIGQFLRADREEGFELSQAPLMRITLIRLDAQRTRLVWGHHHLLLDGWSIPLVLNDVFKFYEIFRNKHQPEWHSPRPYRDYIQWLQEQDFHGADHYWKTEFSDFQEPTPLPGARAGISGVTKDDDYCEAERTLSAELSEALQYTGRAYHLTVNDLLQSAWAMLLCNYSGQADITFGFTTAGRPEDLADVGDIAGLFINTLPLKVSRPESGLLMPWLKKNQEARMEAQNHGYIPLAKIQHLAHLPAGVNLFDSLIVFKNVPMDERQAPQQAGLKFSDFNFAEKTHYPLTLIASSGERIFLKFGYDKARFEQATLDRLFTHLTQLLRDFTEHPFRKVTTCTMMDEAERNRILVAWNQSERPLPDAPRIDHLFNEVAAAHPGKPAVVWTDPKSGETRIQDYASLLARADAVAVHLLATGVGHGSLVGVLLDREPDTIAVLLGLIKAGAAYVPMDTDYPDERIQFMVEDAGLNWILTGNRYADKLHDSQAQVIDTALIPNSTDRIVPDPGLSGGDLAYVIYTSGSTGKPKGVCIPHEAVVRLVRNTDYVDLQPGDVIAQAANHVFDAATFEIWGTLLNGASMAVFTRDEALTPVLFAAGLARFQVTTLFLTTALFNQLVREIPDIFRNLKTLMFGGEAVDPRWVQTAIQAGGPQHLLHVYGPTENTTFSSWFPIQTVAQEAATIPIGGPIANTTIYLLDKRYEVVPIGVSGELCLGGVGLAVGYLNRPALTAEKFTPDPFSGRPGTRLYRSGDLVRYQTDGAIEFQGRIDFQIKLRGFRIELGEIEKSIREIATIEDVIVLVREDTPGDKRIVAYVVGNQATDLRSHLNQRLPAYMVPSAFVFMEQFPMTVNRKIDRRALPVPDLVSSQQAVAQPPTTETEKRLAHIWYELLSLTHLPGVNQDFFELGGHSLLATRLVSKIRSEFEVEPSIRLLFEEPTIAALSSWIDQAAGAESGPPILPVERGACGLPLSYAQQRLFFIEGFSDVGSAYNMPVCYRLRGPRNVAALEQTFVEIERRHEVLRTVYTEIDGDPRQVVQPPRERVLIRITPEGIDAEARLASARRLAELEAARPFQLREDPMLRVFLYVINDTDALLLANMHHIASDGWSLGIFTRLLGELYVAFAEAGPLPAEAAIQYGDFAAWQRTYLKGPVLEKQVAYWREKLINMPDLIHLPTDFPRPAVQSFNGANYTFSTAMKYGLEEVANQTNATPFMILEAVFALLISRYSREPYVPLGTPIANRNRVETEHLIGFFVNTLVFCNDFTGNPSFLELVTRTRHLAVDAYAHQDVPFEEMVQAVQPERETSHSPLFQVMFALQDALLSEAALGDCYLHMEPIGLATAKFDLTLSLTLKEGRLYGAIEYNTDLFLPETPVRMANHFIYLMESLLARPERPICEASMMDATERDHLLNTLNQTSADYPQTAVIHQLFLQWAVKTPQAVALEHWVDDQPITVTYGALRNEALSTAHHLRRRGIRRGNPVGLFMNRNVRTISTKLAILLAGGAYMPIDPEFPTNRIQHMIADAEPELVLTTQDLAPILLDMDTQTLILEDPSPQEQVPIPNINEADDPAYVIYTSGSTGQPKGVVIPHTAVVRLVSNTNYITFTPESITAQVSNHVFDAVTFEIWGPLLNGGRIALFDRDDILTPSLFYRGLCRSNITSLFLTTALFNQMVREIPEIFAGIETLLVGGEAIVPQWVRLSLEKGAPTHFFNIYGPTENTTFTTCFPISEVPQSATSLPIGSPIANTTVYILDHSGYPVPTGIPGELYTGGDGLALGYLKRPALTAQNFVPNPFASMPGKRLYRTGDLVRYLPNHAMEFIGRVDFQIKLRGFRIELGEIEEAIHAQEGVKDALVLLRDDGEKRLVAYVVTDHHQDFAQALKNRLPAYMIPAFFVFMDQLPVTATGKIDRRALPAPEAAGETDEAPRNETERLLASIWAEVLGLKATPRRSQNFFELGGHSLLATRLRSKIREVFNVEIPIRSIFETPTIAALAPVLARTEREDTDPITPMQLDRSQPLPLSFAQQRLHFIESFTDVGAGYNMPMVFQLDGPLDVAVFNRTLMEIEKRHEVLRTVYRTVDGETHQYIQAPSAFPLSLVDLINHPNAEEEARRLAALDTKMAFQLQQDPMLRVTLYRIKPDRYLTTCTMHHIASDGWSFGVFTSELNLIYNSLLQGAPLLEPLKIQYADFAVWQRDHLRGERLEKQLRYWREQLADMPPVLNLPTDFPRPKVQTFNGAYHYFHLNAEVTAEVERLANRVGATPFMVLETAFALLLARYSGEQDIAVGTPIANRNRTEIEGLIGFFVNTLVLRNRLEDADFIQSIKRTRHMTLEAYAYQDVPFELVVEAVRPERESSHSPLFQVMFTVQNIALGDIQLADVKLSPVETDHKTAKFDLTLSLADHENALIAALEYNTDLFTSDTMKRMGEHFGTLLTQLLEAPERPVSKSEMLPESEKAALLSTCRGGGSYPEETIISLFEDHVRQHPDASAVVDGTTRLSYAQLNRRANGLAGKLATFGAGPGQVVALSVPRSYLGIIGILATLKTGAAYLPMDPSNPTDRLAMILEDSGAQILLSLSTMTTDSYAVGQTRLNLDLYNSEDASNPPNRITPAHTAYMCFTSGTTGRPKGAMLPHRGVVRLVCNVDYVSFGPDQAMLQLASPAFDASVWEIWGALLNGGSLIIFPNETPTPRLLARVITQEQASVALITTALFNLTIDEDPGLLKGMQQILIGGEALSVSHMRRALRELPEVRLVNAYGPTENTVIATTCDIPKDLPENARTVPIGKPISSTTALVLDKHHNWQPIGVPGELHLGADGVATGYHQRPAMTAEKFIPNRFSDVEGDRLYKTGDLVRVLPGGAIEFLGRTDFQVKLRGFRIELGEIESVLRLFPAVDNAVVLKSASRHQRLDAWIATTAAPDLEALRAFLKSKLPEYMVPSTFTILETLPLTSGGKLNRHALPDPDEGQGTGTAPATPIEIRLAELWCDLLAVEQVHREDNFFHLGGHSLLITRLQGQIRTVFKQEVSPRDLFEGATLAEMATKISHKGAGEIQEIPRVSRAIPLPVSFAQQRLWFLDQYQKGLAAYNMPLGFKLVGRVDVDALKAALQQLTLRHESMRTHFKNHNGRVVQEIRGEPLIDFEVIDLPTADEVRKCFNAEAVRGFDLQKDLLLRVRLYLTEPDTHYLLLNMSHIISDGWSMGVLFEELGHFYTQIAAGREPFLEPLPLQYADFAAWQRETLSGTTLAQMITFWRETLVPSEALALPLDFKRPAEKRYAGDMAALLLPADLTQNIRKLGQEEGATLFMVFLTAFQIILARYSGQREFNVGTPIAGRNRAELEKLIGFFVNTLVLKADLTGNPNTRTLLAGVRDRALAAFAHQDLPFEKLVEELQPERSTEHTPFFQVMFSMIEKGARSPSFPDIEFQPVPVETGSTKFDLTFAVEDRGGDYALAIEYDTALFTKATIQSMLAQLQHILSGMTNTPDLPFHALPMSSLNTADPANKGWGEVTVVPTDTPIHVRLETLAATQPAAVAVLAGEISLTYGELNQRANSVAHHLQQRGVQVNQVVGILAKRGPDMVTAMLGILKMGAAYLMLDPNNPIDRSNYMLTATKAEILFIPNGYDAGATGAGLTRLEVPQLLDGPRDNRHRPISAQQAAYVCFTSGTTGKPKGVVVSHGSVQNLANNHFMNYGPEQTMLQIASPAFDASVWETWGALLNGGKLVAFPEEQPTPRRIGEINRLYQVRVGLFTTSLFNLIIDEDPRLLNPMTQVLIGGEALSVDHLRRAMAAHPHIHFYNCYGPTENCVIATAERVPPDLAKNAPSVPIGKAIDNTAAHVLDQHLALLPDGVPGELYVSGIGLAQGYFGRGDLTADRFIPDPFSRRPGGRLYRTGDIIRRRADGRLEFIGRRDAQIKLRGFRIETGEIENVMREHPAVKNAVVLLITKGEKRLVGFFTGSQTPETEQTRPLIQHLQEKLPAFMIPTALVGLEDFPLTTNGKLDLTALENAYQPQTREHVDPRNDTERTLLAIWETLFPDVKISVLDNFFELGGHSLLATQLETAVRDRFPVTLPLKELFRLQTLEAIAAEIDRLTEQSGEQEGMLSDMLDLLSDMTEEEALAMLDEQEGDK